MENGLEGERNVGMYTVQKRKWQPHSNILAWEISFTEEPDGLQSTGLKESDTT